jgi:hypothetical protein
MKPAEPGITRGALRTPRSAAVAGIAFAVLFTAALVLIRLAVPAEPGEAGRWLSDGSRRDAVRVALGLVPFAGIAFLWFIGVVRDRIGEAEDRFFSTVFLGSGLLFIAMLFVAAAVAGSLVVEAGEDHQSLSASGTWGTGRSVALQLMTVYAMRMAGVFMIATSTILLRTGVAPRWLASAGFAIAVVLLVTVNFTAWVELLFPAWVLAVSLHILVADSRRDRGGVRDAPAAA